MKEDIKEIIRQIEEEKLFEATSGDGAFTIKINKYVPFFCTAVHAGSRLRQELQHKVHHDEYERWYEEDPMTGELIASMPITLVGHDSRFEYDLNRSPELCIYDVAWGKKVWKTKLTPKEIQVSLQKHHQFYQVVHALVKKLDQLFSGCVVFDIHSYNYRRLERKVPLFNIGTENIDMGKFGKTVEFWQRELSSIEIPGIENFTAQNVAFYGRGYNLEFIQSHFNNALVLPTDIKKVYCDELTGNIFPNIVKQFQQKLKTAILNTANEFCQSLDKWDFTSTLTLLNKSIDSDLKTLDKNLHGLLKNFELLATVNPINTNAEKKRFFKNNFAVIPNFKYQPVNINVFDLKQKLMSLPVQKIQDISIKNLYEAVINSYFDKIDIISTRGTTKFLYNSLRYFGRPSKNDLQNAHYILHLPDITDEIKKEPYIDVEKAIEVFRENLDNYGIQAKIEISSKVISQVMVLNSKKSIQFQPDARFRGKELKALIEHEIGVHMVTTMNSNEQKLKIFNLGLPVNTLTQEGLAILSEFLSGNMTLKRLRKFAFRAVVVDMMCSGADFIECFNFLRNQHHVLPDEAFNITLRVFRGGGFTKDHLYLRGFVKVYKFWKDNNNIEALLIGKTSLNYINTIEEMIGREMVCKPKYITKSFVKPNMENNNPIYNYILSGLK
jgi:uncharacterized protein (TIGR02421 family)